MKNKKCKSNEELIVGILTFNGKCSDQIKYYVLAKDARIVDEGYGRYDGTYFYDESFFHPLKVRYPITYEEFERLNDMGIQHGMSIEKEVKEKAIKLIQNVLTTIDR